MSRKYPWVLTAARGATANVLMHWGCQVRDGRGRTRDRPGFSGSDQPDRFNRMERFGL